MVASAWSAAEPDHPGKADQSSDREAEEQDPCGDRSAPGGDDQGLGDDDRAPRRGGREQPANRSVRELATEDPRGQEREQDRPADGHGLAEERPVGRPVGGAGGQLRLGPEQTESPGRLGVLEDDHEQAHDQRSDREPDGDSPRHARAAALEELGGDGRAEARHAAPASSLVRRMKCSSSDSRAIARCVGGTPAETRISATSLRRLEGHRVAEFESPLASPQRRQAGRPQGGLGRHQVPGIDFQPSVAPPF